MDEIPAGPPVSGASERALPAQERSKQEAAGQEHHIPVFSNPDLGQQEQEEQPSSWPTPAAPPARAPMDDHSKTQAVKDRLTDKTAKVAAKAVRVLFGN